MSHQLQLAVAFPTQAILFVVLPIVAVLMLIAWVVRSNRRKKATLVAWDAAASELGIQFVPNGSNLGPVARGRVNEHVVSISPAVRGGRKRRLTRYSVKFDAAEAPEFNLVRRINSTTPVVDTGNPKFDAVVSVQTDQPELLGDFLTGPRRAAILRLLTHFPAAQVTNTEAHLLTVDIEQEKERLVDSVCHLVATAETFDRAEHDATETSGHPSMDSPRAPGSDARGDVSLDEVSVLDDLFNSGLDDGATGARFEEAYQGHEISWTGEVLRVSTEESGLQRVVAFVGSADGTSPDSGRVVAMTLLKPEPRVIPGDVVSFGGALAKLDTSQRLFHVV